MAKSLVHCRICKGEIDRDNSIENVDWIMPSRNYFYHCKCYNDWKRKKNDVHAEANDEMWFEAIKEYLSKDLKISVDYAKLTSQWKNLIKKGKTAKGIYFSLKYFYDITHGDIQKSEGGIGIVSFIYDDACRYWLDRESKEKNVVSKIEEQIKERISRKQIVLLRAEKAKATPRFSLEDIGLEADK